MFSTCTSVCPFVRQSVCPFVSFQSCEHDILKTNEPIVMQIGKSDQVARA